MTPSSDGPPKTGCHSGGSGPRLFRALTGNPGTRESSGTVRAASAEQGRARLGGDDGHGFDRVRERHPDPGHLGLIEMRERAELPGATVGFRVPAVPWSTP